MKLQFSLLNLKSFITVTCLTLTYSAWPQSYQKNLAESFRLFKLGSYSKSLDSLKLVSGNQKTLGTRFYLQGVVLNRLQRYDEAIISFQKAIQNNNQSKDLYYEYGQSLYANSDLLKARKAFNRSYKLNFKKGSSLYYVAHVSQLLEEHKLAKEAYAKLIKESKNDKKLIQIARFQLAESLLSLAENRDDSKVLVKKYVIPGLKQAKSELPEAPIATDIQKRIKEVERQYGLDPNLMKNGKVLSNKRLSARFRHEFRYDSNITLATDVPTAASLQKDTFIHETNFNLNYLMNVMGRYTITPFFRLRNTYHTDRETSTVYQNDTYNITAGLNNTYETTAFGRKANYIFNVDYVYIGRDANAQKERPFFSRATTFTFGKRFRYFNFGPTTIRLKYKDYVGYTESINNKTKTISIDQIKSLSGGNLLIMLFQADLIDNYNNTQTSTNNYLFRTDFLIPDIYPSYTLNAALSVSLLDTKLQENRGLEKTISPSLSLRKKLTKSIGTLLGYDYTNNISKDKQSFDYTKHTVRFEININY